MTTIKEPQLHCPRCGAPAFVVVDMAETGADVEVGFAFPVAEVEFVAQASCSRSCGREPLDMPAHSARYRDSGWIPPAPFNEQSKAWYAVPGRSR